MLRVGAKHLALRAIANNLVLRVGTKHLVLNIWGQGFGSTCMVWAKWDAPWFFLLVVCFLS